MVFSRKKVGVIFTSILTVLILNGCAATSNRTGNSPVAKFYVTMEKMVATERYGEAAIEFQKKKKSFFTAKEQVLYNLELGMLYHLAGNYSESEKVFEEAERRMDDLYSQSISDAALSFVVNDRTIEFQGEDFEKIMVNIFRAMNHAVQGNLQEAMVEARKVDHKLNKLSDRYKKGENAYQKDAFARYLTGVLYETAGSDDDALIAYHKSFEAYKEYQSNYGTPIPLRLKQDLLRVSKKLEFNDRYIEYKNKFSGVSEAKPFQADHGELVYASYDGLIPLKVPDYHIFNIYIPGSVPYTMKLAFPRFAERANAVERVQVTLIGANGKSYQSVSFEGENVGAIGIRNLEDHVGLIKTKAIARATAKMIAAKVAEHQAEENFGMLAGIAAGVAVNTLANASEEIDDRSWRFLPAQINLTRISAPKGVYTVKAEYFNASGNKTDERVFKNVKLEAGSKVFLKARTSAGVGYKLQHSSEKVALK